MWAEFTEFRICYDVYWKIPDNVIHLGKKHYIIIQWMSLHCYCCTWKYQNCEEKHNKKTKKGQVLTYLSFYPCLLTIKIFGIKVRAFRAAWQVSWLAACHSSISDPDLWPQRRGREPKRKDVLQASINSHTVVSSPFEPPLLRDCMRWPGTECMQGWEFIWSKLRLSVFGSR